MHESTCRIDFSISRFLEIHTIISYPLSRPLRPSYVGARPHRIYKVHFGPNIYQPATYIESIKNNPGIIRQVQLYLYSLQLIQNSSFYTL